MEINLLKVCMTMINFLILFFILKYFFWNKIRDVIEERHTKVLNTIENAKKIESDAKAIYLENEEILKNARIEGKKITEKRKKQADIIHDEIIEEAKNNAKLIEQKSKKEIEREKQAALLEVKTQSIELAVVLSKKVLEKELDETLQKEIIESFIDDLEV